MTEPAGTIRDLTEYLTPNLVLPYRGTTYVAPPPSYTDGLVLAAILITSPSLHDPAAHAAAVESLPARSRELFDAAQGRDLGELALGAAYEQMVADGMPLDDLNLYSWFAMIRWVNGVEAADAFLDRMREHNGGEATPKAPARPRSRSGRSTASESQTPTGSTATTSSPKSSGQSTTGSQKESE